MSVSTVTLAAARRGVTIEIRGGRVVCRPGSALTPDLLNAIREIKPDLLRLLPDIGANPPPKCQRPPLDPSYWDSVGYPTASLTPLSRELPCRCCFGTRWWRRASSSTEWICVRCHPPMCAGIEVRDA